MERFSVDESCPFSKEGNISEETVLSTNWEYLQTMKMNTVAPSANMGPVTRPGTRTEGRRFVPWFWPDDELAQSVKIRQAAFMNNPDGVLNTNNENHAVREAAGQLLWLQSRYLAEHFPEKYTLEKTRKFGWVVINRSTDDQFSLRPKHNEAHPLAISGMLSQEDICIVRQKKNGRHILAAGFLASPTNWSLASFMNADMDAVHRHVKGYHKPAVIGRDFRLKDTVDKTLENLREYPNNIITRNNQFIEYSPLLSLEPGVDKQFDKERVMEDLGNRVFLRTERETLTRLPAPYDEFTIFTIKPHVYRLADVREHRGADFQHVLAMNSVIRSALRSHKRATGNKSYDFTDAINEYLMAENPTT